MSDASDNALESTARDRRSVGLHLDISSIHPSQPDGAGALPILKIKWFAEDK